MDSMDLRVFTIVYESASFSEASKRLFFSPQGTAKKISHMEADLGVELFTRTKKGIVPTHYGTALYNKAQEIQLLFDDIQAIGSMRSTGKQTLSVFSTHGFLSYLGPRFFSGFADLHPDVILNAIELPDSLLPAAFVEQRTHLGFVMGPVDDLNYEGFYVATNSYRVILPGSHPLAAQDAITLQGLSTIPLAIRGKEYNVYSLNLNKFIKEGVYPNIALESSEDSFLFSFVADGRGGAVVLDFQTQQEPFASYMADHGLVALTLADTAFERDVYFVVPRDASLTPLEEELREYVRSKTISSIN